MYSPLYVRQCWQMEKIENQKSICKFKKKMYQLAGWQITCEFEFPMTLYLVSRSANNLFCFSNFKFKSIIICAFSPFRLCRSVSCSCWVNNLLSSCEIFAAAAALVPFDGVAIPDLNCSFSTDNFKFKAFNSWAVSSKRLSVKQKGKHQIQLNSNQMASKRNLTNLNWRDRPILGLSNAISYPCFRWNVQLDNSQFNRTAVWFANFQQKCFHLQKMPTIWLEEVRKWAIGIQTLDDNFVEWICLPSISID